MLGPRPLDVVARELEGLFLAHSQKERAGRIEHRDDEGALARRAHDHLVSGLHACRSALA